MKNKYSRRSFLKQALGTLLSFIGLFGGGYVYARFIEPNRLQINELEISHKLIPPSYDGKRIIQFSDTHLGFQYTQNQLQQHVKKINSLDPDLILFTGDLLDNPNEYDRNSRAQAATILQTLSAPLGKFAVYGNHDHGGYGTDIYKSIMEMADFQLLNNHSVEIALSDGSSISLLGVDDAMLGHPNIGLAKKHSTEGNYQILISHAPDLADEAAQAGIHLQLSGHSHGGQIQLPFAGALITPPFAERYSEGMYKVGQTPMTVYVNRGLGTTRLPFRFLSVPEITVLTLKSTQRTNQT